MSRTHDVTGEGWTEVELSAVERHRLLSVERRRGTLDVISERATPVGLADLAAAVAAREDDGDATDDAVERTAIELHHRHLPKMTDLGVIDYDPESRLVRSA